MDNEPKTYNIPGCIDDEAVTQFYPGPFERMRDVAKWLPGLVVAVGACVLVKTFEHLRSDQDRS